MALEIAQSIQQTTFDNFHKQILEQKDNKPNIIKTMMEIFENQSLNTFSEFLRMDEIDEVFRTNLIMSYHFVQPNVFIQQLKVGEYEKYYNTMNLFAFGTYRQFLENKDKLIPLTPVMDKKLKHLTILTLATQKKTLPYDDLMVELDLKNVRHLEDIIIEAIYAGENKPKRFH
jgi:hypothetical protein